MEVESEPSRSAPDSALGLAGDNSKKWYHRDHLRVAFLGCGIADPRCDKVLEIANEWQPHTGIRFEKSEILWTGRRCIVPEHDESDIRVGFGFAPPDEESVWRQFLHGSVFDDAEYIIDPGQYTLRKEILDDATSTTVNEWTHDTGSWSFVGTDANYHKCEVTLNLGFGVFQSLPAGTHDKNEWRRVVLHEFGHALGFKHEHTNAEDRVPYDEDKVIEFYAKPPTCWSPAQTRHNVLTPNAGAPLLQPGYGKRSIMAYQVPEELLDKSDSAWSCCRVWHSSLPRWTEFVTGNNYELSETDKAMARQWYL